MRARSKRTERERTRDSPLALRLSSFVILLSPPFVLPRPYSSSLTVINNNSRCDRHDASRDRFVGEGEISERRKKGERCDGILLPDGNTSGRKGEREKGSEGWRGSGRIDGSDSQQASSRLPTPKDAGAAPRVLRRRSPRSSAGLTTGLHAANSRFFFFFFSFTPLGARGTSRVFQRVRVRRRY